MYASWLAPGRNHLYWGAEGTGVGIIVVLALLLMVFHDSFSDSPLWWGGGGDADHCKYEAVYRSCGFNVTQRHTVVSYLRLLGINADIHCHTLYHSLLNHRQFTCFRLLMYVFSFLLCSRFRGDCCCDDPSLSTSMVTTNRCTII